MADEQKSETVTTIPTPSAPQARDYRTEVYQALQELGANNPDALLIASGDYWKHCQKLSVAPQVTAAIIYGAERHRREVTRTTINEPSVAREGLMAETPKVEAPSISEASKIAYRYADVSFDRLDDAQKFAGLLEKAGSNIGTYVAGTKHGATVTTNAAPDVIAKVLKKHRWKGGAKPSEAAKMAAEARGEGGVQSQIAAKMTPECHTCIPWQKVARDPKVHADFAKLAKKFGKIETPLDVYAVVGDDLNKETQEVFLVLPLNIHSELMAPAYEVARGQRDRVAVGIDNVLDAASDARCAAFVVVHQHPGDSPEPSPADVKLTHDIRAATPPGRVFVDHVVIGVKTAYSITKKKLYKVK